MVFTGIVSVIYGVIKSLWFTRLINTSQLHDINLLTSIIKQVLLHHYVKIRNLVKYLNNVAKLFNALELPISWVLPTGLVVKQSYLQVKTTSISLFMFSKIKLNLKVKTSKYDKNKEITALMPNLIHSLHGTSLLEASPIINLKLSHNSLLYMIALLLR